MGSGKSKIVDFNKESIGKLPNDKPVIYRILMTCPHMHDASDNRLARSSLTIC